MAHEDLKSKKSLLEITPSIINGRLLLSFFLLAVGLSTNVVFAQKKTIDYLAIQGQARYDSLEFHYISVLMEMDSVAAFSEINSLKTYADKNKDELLSLFADFMKVRYDGIGNRKSSSERYNSFKQIQTNLSKISTNPLRERFNAELEYHMGGVLYKGSLMSNKIINHLLSADLYYRKVGYENIFFADIKLTNLGKYYMNEVAEIETALKYLEEAELYVSKDPLDRYRIEVYKTYANCLVEKKLYSEAIKYNKLAIAQVRLRRDSLKIGTLSGNIGEIILNTFPNPVEAEPYFQKELVYRLRFKPKGVDDLAKVYGNLCRVAGLKRKREDMVLYFDKAINILKDYKDTVDKHGVLMSVYKNRMIADTLLGDYKSAYYHEKLYYVELMASQRQDLKISTSEASVKFDAERNKFQAELAKQQAQNSRFWVLIVSLLLLIALIGGYLLYYRQRSKKNDLARQLTFEQKEAERLAVLDGLKTRFFTNISHEFRTPLTLLVGPLTDLSKRFPNEWGISVMKRNVTRLQKLINQLLDLSKLDAGKLEVVIRQDNMVMFMKQVLASFESLAQSKQIIFQYSQNLKEREAYFDADKIETIISNLLSNAFKFTPKNGRILVNLTYETTHAQINIQDFGIGISAEKLPFIFDRFYQVNDDSHQNYEGTGIGLALVKELVEILQGQISVKSAIEKGTEFEIILPIDKETWKDKKVFTEPYKITIEPASEIDKNIEPNFIEANKETPILLIVEDNADLRHFIKRIFAEKYQVFEAVNGQTGLELAVELIPDIIITDLMMPILDGIGFCKGLKSDVRTSHIPVIMLTAKATNEDRLEGLELGADDYLTKPFNIDELTIRVKNLVIQRENLRLKYSQLSVDSITEMPFKLPSMDEQFLQKAIEIVEKNIADSAFDLEQFCEQMNMSRATMHRKLKAITNQTTTEFIRNLRLQKAAKLLKQKTGTVSDIAYQVGFENLPYFSKTFQEYFGISPSEWAK